MEHAAIYGGWRNVEGLRFSEKIKYFGLDRTIGLIQDIRLKNRVKCLITLLNILLILGIFYVILQILYQPIYFNNLIYVCAPKTR